MAEKESDGEATGPSDVTKTTSSNDNTKKVIIIVVVALIVCAVVCGVLTLGSGLLVQQGANQLVNELEEGLKPFEDNLKTYEDDFRDLNGTDGDLELFPGMTGGEWPADMPSDVPVYKHGSIRLASTDNESNIVSVLLYEFSLDAFEDYKSDLEAAGWTIDSDVDSDVDSRVDYLTASKGNLELQYSVSIADDSGFVTVRIGN
ncbi:MAG: hypothetical protein ACE5DX_02215 [Candidatus Dojkabacteria bacterium]